MGRGLSPADLRLWAAFTGTVEVAPVVAVVGVVPPAVSARKIVAPAELGVNIVPGGLDKSTWKNFASGKIKVVRRLDLHGLTAMRAHLAVTAFIERAYGEQVRCVEIITGKGEVLARELPHWLNGAMLRRFVLAVAHPHAGNTGSVRILLRRVRGS